MCATERRFRPKRSQIVRKVTPMYFSVLVHLRTRKVLNSKIIGNFAFQALQFETNLMRTCAKTQKYKGVIFEQFDSS